MPRSNARFGWVLAALSCAGCGVSLGRDEVEVDGAALRVVRLEETYFFVRKGAFGLSVTPLPSRTPGGDPRFPDLARRAADRVAARRCGKAAQLLGSSFELDDRWGVRWGGYYRCPDAWL